MARKNVIGVFQAFLAGESKRGATISTDGKTIFSYSTPIAWGVFDAAGRLSGLEISAGRWSVTTTAQQNGLQSLAEDHPWLAVSIREVAG